MGLIDLASGKSLWRGMEYYEKKIVIAVCKAEENKYKGVVKGSEDNKYDVVLDIAHPRSSTCTCPFADGRRVICKHMVAAYFTIFPDEAKRIVKEAEEYEIEFEKQQENERKEIKKYVYSLSKSELREQLLNYMLSEYDNEYW